MKNNQAESKIIKWRTFPGRLYAEMVAEALQKQGIYCVIKGEDVGILGGSVYGSSSPGKVTIWLTEDNRERAEQIAVEMIDHI
ncbi:MAG TPA: DUF2007 domain-containing protein [Bacteroidetes bacterium]|nr:DUF2007 domain-containing protein [Bacteroidota bacterium]